MTKKSFQPSTYSGSASGGVAYRFLVLVFTFLIANTLSFAQTTGKIRIADALDNSPVIGVGFQYENQKGSSDANGIIAISFSPEATLKLSHISYGQWILEAEEVKNALKTGTVYREKVSLKLQPVSIVAMHPESKARRMELNYTDRQHHDAGAILNSDISINGIRKSGSYGFDPVLRGFKYDQLNVVMNGSVAAAAACPNRMDPVTSQIPVNIIDNIQILKGPYSLRFGNSFGGTINFLTAESRYSDTLNYSGRFSSTYENNGKIFRSEGIIGIQSKKLEANVFGSWSQGKDYHDGMGRAVPSGFLRGSFGSQLTFRIDEWQEISLSANRNMGRDTDFPALPMDLREDDTWMVNAAHGIRFSGVKTESWKTNVYFSHVDHLMDNLLKPLNPRTVNAKSPAETLTWGGRSEITWRSEGITIYSGLDLKAENAEGSRFREMLTGPMAGKVFVDNIWQKSTLTRTGAFVESNLMKGNYLFVLAARIELNQAAANDPATEFANIYQEITSSQVNPGVSLGSIRSWDNRYTVKLWAGRAQRSGSLTERFINYFPVGRDAYELLGNPGLKPEVNNQADLIIEMKTQNTFLYANLFVAYLQNHISSVIQPDLKPRMTTSPGVRKFTNTGNAMKSGFEFSWKQNLPLGLRHLAAMAYTYGVNRENNQPLPEIAPFEVRYTLSANHFSDKLGSEILIRHAAAQNRIADDFGEKQTPAFTTADVNLSYRVRKNMNLSAGIQNIFNETYYEHLNRPLNGNPSEFIYNRGRNYSLSLVFNFE
jgi:iron complex outermembrane recepter protein